MPNMVHFTEFLKNAKIEKFKYDILSDVNQWRSFIFTTMLLQANHARLSDTVLKIMLDTFPSYF